MLKTPPPGAEHIFPVSDAAHIKTRKGLKAGGNCYARLVFTTTSEMRGVCVGVNAD